MHTYKSHFAPSITRITSDRITFLAFWCLILAGLIAFCLMAFQFWPYTMDDSYITYRYARNFSKGYGLVFNSGEYMRSEGITSPVYAILLSMTPENVDISVVSKFLGILSSGISSIFIGILVFRLSGHLSSSHKSTLKIISVASSCYILSNPNIVGNSLSGMETALSGLVLIFFVFLISYIASLSDKQNYSIAIASGIAGTLVPMLRPELLLFVIITVSALFFLIPDRRKYFQISIISIAIFGISYFIIRYNYYQTLLPLPFYIKQGKFGFFGLAELKLYLLDTLPLLCVAGAGFTILQSRKFSLDIRTRQLFTALLIASVCQLAYYATIRHIMGFALRYFQPVSEVIVVLGFISIGILYGIFNKSDSNKTIFQNVILTCMLGFLFFGNFSSYKNTKFTLIDWYTNGFGEINFSSHQNIQHIIKASKNKNLTIAMNDCGLFPFYTQFHTIDLAGLNNRFIALGHSQKTTLLEIKKHSPDIIILRGNNKNAPDSLLRAERLNYSDIQPLGYNYSGAMKVGKFLNKKDYFWLFFTKHDNNTNNFLNELSVRGIFKYY